MPARGQVNLDHDRPCAFERLSTETCFTCGDELPIIHPRIEDGNRTFHFCRPKHVRIFLRARDSLAQSA